MSRSSLYSRCQGPNARPVDQLVRQGEHAAAEVCKRYDDFLMSGLDRLQDHAARFLADRQDTGKQGKFLEGVQDLASSAATAGREWVSRFAVSLEDAMLSRDVLDEHIPVIVALHLDALKVAAGGGVPEAELAHLEGGLARAAAALGEAQSA